MSHLFAFHVPFIRMAHISPINNVWMWIRIEYYSLRMTSELSEPKIVPLKIPSSQHWEVSLPMYSPFFSFSCSAHSRPRIKYKRKEKRHTLAHKHIQTRAHTHTKLKHTNNATRRKIEKKIDSEPTTPSSEKSKIGVNRAGRADIFEFIRVTQYNYL